MMSRRQTLEEAFSSCVVQIADEGTGFFIAPQTIATAAHVVRSITGRQGAPADTVEVVWDGETAVCEIENMLDGDDGPYKRFKWPDVAILQVPQDVWKGHPCVKLDPSQGPPSRKGVFVAFGYPKRLHAVQRTPLELSYRGPHGTDERHYENFGGERVQEGFSGAPVLDLSRRSVAQILVTTLNAQADEGALAVPIPSIRELDEVVERNSGFHRSDARWREAARRVPRYVLPLAGVLVAVMTAILIWILFIRDVPTGPFGDVDGIAVTRIGGANDDVGEWIAGGLAQLQPVDVEGCAIGGNTIEVWPPSRTESSRTLERADRANADLLVGGSASVNPFDGQTDLSMTLEFVAVGARDAADPSLINEVRTTTARLDLARDLEDSALNKLPELRTVPELLVGLRALDSGEPAKARCVFESARQQVVGATSQRGNELVASIDLLIAVTHLRQAGLERDMSHVDAAEAALASATKLTDFDPGTAEQIQIDVNLYGVDFLRTVAMEGGLHPDVSVEEADELRKKYRLVASLPNASNVVRVLSSVMQGKIALASALSTNERSSYLDIAEVAVSEAIDISASDPDSALDPYFADGYSTLGGVSAEKGHFATAAKHFSTAATLVGGQIQQRYLLNQAVAEAASGMCSTARMILRSVADYDESSGAAGLAAQVAEVSGVVGEMC